MPVLWAYARDLFQTPGFGDTVDFVQIKQHYYIVHADINPTRIVPKGPELANWLTPHGREALGGRPFGDGTPPGPPLAGERCPTATAPSPRRVRTDHSAWGTPCNSPAWSTTTVINCTAIPVSRPAADRRWEW